MIDDIFYHAATLITLLSLFILDLLSGALG